MYKRIITQFYKVSSKLCW